MFLQAMMLDPGDGGKRGGDQGDKPPPGAWDRWVDLTEPAEEEEEEEPLTLDLGKLSLMWQHENMETST